MAKFVLDSYALDSKKSEAKAKVAGALGSSVSISGNEIEVPSYAAEKVAQILSQVVLVYNSVDKFLGGSKYEIFSNK